jgi:predicted ATPase
MELVYLWIEDYKNIHKQGFNFSPNFECEFFSVYEKYTDENGEEKERLQKDCELKITPKENLLKDFFGKNINVTAIVGENGSGKSSLLVGITNGKSIFKIDNKYFGQGFDLKRITAPLKINEIDISENIIYLDFDLIKINPITTPFQWFNFPIYNKNLYRKTEKTSRDTNFSIEKFREHFFNIIIEHIDSFELEIFFYNPLKIFFDDYLNSNKKFEHINKLIIEVKEINFTKEKFLVFLYLKISEEAPTDIAKVDKVSELLKIENEILKEAEYLKLGDINEIYDFLGALNNKELFIKEFNDIYKKYKDSFLKLIDIGYIRIDFKDKIKRKYFDLSQGERKFFTEMLMIFDAIKKSKKNEILLVLDEPDLTFHPDWQKKYINEMIKLLSNFSEKKFHLIITTHSPFILSDLPKQNIIFLEKDKETGNCINATNKVDINPFGANIHTLLSHGFFMKDGLMGEFAKDKIDKAIKYLNQKVLTKDELDYCENIISIIGEPIIKRQLQKMLDSKRLSEIEQIKKEIKALEERMTLIWKNSK